MSLVIETKAKESGAGTAELVRRWCEGDKEALGQLLREHGLWIRGRIRRRLGGKLRRKLESQDVLQTACTSLLSAPRDYEVQTDAQFRALIGQYVENVIRGMDDWFRAKRRDMDREQDLSAPGGGTEEWAHARVAADPSERVEAGERRELLRLALRTLAPHDRRVIELREFEGLSFREVGRQLEKSEGAACMAHKRAVARLAQRLEELGGSAVFAA